MFKNSSIDKKENKLNYQKGKDCFEELCKNLKESAMEIINYEKKKKKLALLTHKENNFYNE